MSWAKWDLIQKMERKEFFEIFKFQTIFKTNSSSYEEPISRLIVKHPLHACLYTLYNFMPPVCFIWIISYGSFQNDLYFRWRSFKARNAYKHQCSISVISKEIYEVVIPAMQKLVLSINYMSISQHVSFFCNSLNEKNDFRFEAA